MGSLVKEQLPFLWWGTDFEIRSEMSHLPLFPISLNQGSNLVVVILSLMNLGFNLLMDLIIHSLVLDDIPPGENSGNHFRIWIMTIIFINILTELQLCCIQFPSPRGILTLWFSFSHWWIFGSNLLKDLVILSLEWWILMRRQFPRGKIRWKIPDLDHGTHLFQCPHWPTALLRLTKEYTLFQLPSPLGKNVIGLALLILTLKDAVSAVSHINPEDDKIQSLGKRSQECPLGLYQE